MPAYDASRFFPPAPVALVTLRNPATDAVVSNVAMLIDSGADATMVPESLATALGVEINGCPEFEIVGVDGNRSFAKAVSLDLLFLGRRFRGAFLVTPNDYGVLGRNVLNRISLVLHGPHLMWDELRVPTA